MMASLVLLVPIVVSVTAAPLQQILDDRLVGQTKETFPVSPEVGVGSVKVDSKKPSRKQTMKVNGDAKETKTSQVLLPIPNQDDRLSSFPRTFPVLPESGLPSSKKMTKKQPTTASNRQPTGTIKSQSATNQFQTGATKLHPGTTKLQYGTNKLQPGTKSVTEQPVSKTKSTSEENDSQEPEVKGKVMKKGRKHKAFFLNYPFVPQIHHHYPNLPDYDSNFEDCDFGIEERTPGGKKKYQDSKIYYIRLPPTPYMFVPGLGYISQPPRYSPPLSPHLTHVRPLRPARPPTIYQPHVNPFIKLPIDFVSNGKPTSVYQWPSQDGKPSPRPENHISNLDKGPYSFNGRPSSIYLLRPDGSQTVPQPIRYTDYQDNGYYWGANFV